MVRLDDPNPYELLGIDINAGKKAIDKAFSLKTRGSQKNLVRSAYASLRKPEDRLLIDALTPAFSIKEVDLTSVVVPDAKDVNWAELLDIPAIHLASLQRLREATARCLLRDLPGLEQPLEMNLDFDGLQEFENQWLK